MRHLSWLAGCVLVLSCTVNSSNLGGETATGGGAATGGTPGSGGALATGGQTATGGTPGTGGESATGGTTETGGQTGAGGNSATGGRGGGGGRFGFGGRGGAGGRAATGGQGGATDTGGQTGTGGDGTGGQTATGGTGGQSGGTGGTATGGQTGTGGQGGSNATCTRLESQYTTALSAAKDCTPNAPNQCKALAYTSLSCPGCQTYVNDTTQLDMISTAWTNAGCDRTHGPCPAIACVAPQSTHCAPQSSTGPGAPSGTCTIGSQPVQFAP
jgi:hypothetical protein